MDDSRIKKAGDLLSAFLSPDKVKEYSEYTGFSSGWRSLVGERFAAHSRVKDIRRGILIIEVDHSGWIQLLQMRESEILTAITRKYTSLRIRGIAYSLIGTIAEKLVPENDLSTKKAIESMGSTHLPSLDAIEDESLKAVLGGLKRTLEERED